MNNDAQLSPISAPNAKQQNYKVLVVDDDRTMLMMLEAKLHKQGYETISARNGNEACTLLEQEYKNLDAILLDREMPEMNGMEVIKWIKQRPEIAKLPIIMQTGSNHAEQIKEGIDAGIFYYLIKPVEDDILKSVLAAAMRESRHQKILSSEMQRHSTSFKLMQDSFFILKTLQEAEDLACFLANCFPDSEQVLAGLAQLLINAVEHGNLEISYDEKTELVSKGSWREEVLRRQNLPMYSNRQVSVFFKKEGDTYKVKITDDGKGFSWKKFMKIDPARAMDNHGRGIAQANMTSFDQVNYNEKGNEVIAIVEFDKNEKPLDW